MHRHLHVEGESVRASDGRRQARADLGARDGADLTVVYGVNHDKLTKDHLVVSNASCTTNCLVPVAKVLNDAVGIEKGIMTTIHLHQRPAVARPDAQGSLSRPRRGLSMIPTSTGAAKAVGLVLPELKGKLDGISVRVPTPNVSLVDLKFISKRATTVEEINDAIKAAARARSKAFSNRARAARVVDFNHDPASSSFALDQTKVLDGNLRQRDELVRQ
jgi:glyceraldehyde 3-phosphate dehydrogenase